MSSFHVTWWLVSDWHAFFWSQRNLKGIKCINSDFSRISSPLKHVLIIKYILIQGEVCGGISTYLWKSHKSKLLWQDRFVCEHHICLHSFIDCAVSKIDLCWTDFQIRSSNNCMDSKINFFSLKQMQEHRIKTCKHSGKKKLPNLYYHFKHLLLLS